MGKDGYSVFLWISKTAILVKELFVNRIFNNTANILTSNYNSTKYFQSELHFDYTVRDKFLVEEH